nr:molybdopterin cofactor-binding domain-containing protein [Actinosynnema pretiosum]
MERESAGRESAARGGGLGRRGFLGYVLAAPVLVAGAELAPARAAGDGGAAGDGAVGDGGGGGAVGGADLLLDLNSVMTAAALPTAHLITVEVGQDGVVSFALPRTEVGQGVTTSTAMLIAEELDVPLERVRVTLADARPELLFNQLTGGSNTTIATYLPIRVAAATARSRLLDAAAGVLGAPAAALVLSGGLVTAPSGRRVGIGELSAVAAADRTARVAVTLKPDADFRVIGTPRTRVDALDAVTGRKRFAMDLDVPGAKPTMLCRPPTINGRVSTVDNLAQVRAMPGVTDVAVVSTGVAVRAQTFGQCVDAVRALRVTWRPGPVGARSEAAVLAELRAAEPPLGPAPPLTQTVEDVFTFHFRGNSALEPNCAVADVRADRAEVWSALKSPIVAKKEIAAKLGLPPSAVTVHVVEGGGSFGRKLFCDAALEAAEASRAFGNKPVKLMWHRADDCRQGRAHPMSTSRVRVSHLGSVVLGYAQRHASVRTDFGHGLGELLTAMAARLPLGDAAFSQTFFHLSQAMPYEFGATTRLLGEAEAGGGFNTGSMRGVYSPDVTCARELVVDRLARRLGQDPFRFRLAKLREERARAALLKAADVAGWGRSMPARTAQGIALHAEYHSVVAVVVEIDCRPEVVNRRVRDAVTGPRVTRVVVAVDVGLAVNPSGLRAQLTGAASDGIALALTSSLHLRDGHFLEASWDDYAYTRQWNTPFEVEVVVLPGEGRAPGGAGELGVPAVMAAVACAYARATGTDPTVFPINHGALSFTPKPTVPPVPAPPDDGAE